MNVFNGQPVASLPVKAGHGGLRRHYVLGAVAATLVTASFVAGFFLGESQNQAAASGTDRLDFGTRILNLGGDAPAGLEDVDFSQFWDVWKAVKDKYVGSKDLADQKMFYGAIEGMVASLGDPYSVYFDPETAKKFSDELGGTFEGIGAELGMKKGQITVIAPLAGTPAEKAGLKAGDFILAIDGEDTAGLFLDEAVSRIRGPKGTEVKLTILHDEELESQEITITRATIIVESVKFRVEKTPDGKKTAVITVSHFNDDTAAGFAEAVRRTLLESPDGLVLDLRNNPGGYLDTAVKVAGEWVNREPVVIEQYSDGTRRNHDSDGAGRLADLPTVVLMNGGSASAAEILAGALQDYGKAKLVGEKTFGKGSVQDYSEFGDGSALKLTVALWLTPNGRSINKEGIAPDIEVKNTTEDWDSGRDPQFDKAVELLTGYVKPAVPATAPEKK
jgi:carboxyl-terminal processing protease